MSRVLAIVGLLGLAFIAEVASHGHLSIPISRDVSLQKRQDEQNPPVEYPLISDFVCRNYSASPSSQWATLTAGSTTPIQWALEAPHPGDCFAYLTYDDDTVADTKKKWFKIAEFGQCNLQNLQTQQMMIPSYLPSCDHCILRWEWYGLHLQSIGIVEFYSQCADVRIIGKANGQLPTPQVTIPGHLPMDADKYRPGFNSNDFTMTGPPIAKIGGANYSCVGTYGNSCVKPTPTKNPCTISTQRCMSATTYQACGIGLTTTVWGPEQSCQEGLVCAAHPDGAHIMCTYPSTPTTPTPTPTPTPTTPTPTPTTPTPTPTPTPTTPSSGSCTSGYMKCLTSETFSMCNLGSWGVSQSCAVGTQCTPSGNYIYCNPASTPSAPTTPSTPTAPSTTGQTAAPAPKPSTPTSTPSTPSSSGDCTKLGSMVCVGQNSYSTCSQTRTTPAWSQPQSCPTGLKCSPSGDYIFCL